MKNIYYNNDRAGIYYNLEDIFNSLNAAYFDNKIKATIKWSPQSSLKKPRRSSIQLGCYDHKLKEIRISPVLDQAYVPFFSIERIVFHEMLHQLYPTRVSPSGRRIIHSKAFKMHEKQYFHLGASNAWIKANLKKLLHYQPFSLKGP